MNAALYEAFTLLEFLPVSNEDGEDVPPGAPLDKSAVMSDGSNRCYIYPDVTPLDEYLPSTTTTDGTDYRMPILHKTLQESLRLLIIHAEDGFPVNCSHGSTLQCFPVLISYFCDIPESKDVSAIRHGHRISQPCVWFVTARQDISYVIAANKMTMSQTLDARPEVEEVLENVSHYSKLRALLCRR